MLRNFEEKPFKTCGRTFAAPVDLNKSVSQLQYEGGVIRKKFSPKADTWTSTFGKYQLYPLRFAEDNLILTN